MDLDRAGLEQCTQSMCPSWTRSLEEATVLGRLTTLKTWDLTAKSWNSATMLVKQSVVSTGWQHGSKGGGGFQTFQHAVIVPRCSTNSISKIIYGLTVIAAQGPWTRVALEFKFKLRSPPLLSATPHQQSNIPATRARRYGTVCSMHMPHCPIMLSKQSLHWGCPVTNSASQVQPA